MTHRQRKKITQKNQLGSIRIISGQWRGRKLSVLDAQGLRPTTDRVKETLFNWIAQDIPNAYCLDLFAGSGGLGLEAASRYAQQVTLCELNKSAYQQLLSNKQLLKADNVDIHHTDCLNFLKNKPSHPYDIIFIDPPFRQQLLNECFQLLESNQWLSNNALVYIEFESELNSPDVPTNWQQLKTKTAGQVQYQLYQREIK